MSDFLPTLNSSGVFKIKTPISDAVNTKLIFTCKSIRKISELNSSGVNVYQTYYVANGLSAAVYQSDRSNDISIIGLYSDDASWIYLPSSQLESYPDSSGHAYRRMGLAIDLGPLEESYDLDSLHDLIGSLIYSQLGVTAKVRSMSLSKATMVKSDDHEAIKAMRLGKIEVEKTVFAENKTMAIQLDEARVKIKALEDFIINLQP